MEEAEEVLLGGAEAHVDHLDVVLDCPVQPRGELNRAPGHIASEHAHAVDFCPRSDRVDNPGARRTMTRSVDGLLIGSITVVILRTRVVFYNNAAAHTFPHCRMIPFDAA